MTNLDILVKWLEETGLDELELVGGKNASLGEMLKGLSDVCRIPSGFIVTSTAYDMFMKHNNLHEEIQVIIGKTDTDNLSELMTNGAAIRQRIYAGVMPPSIILLIKQYYKEFSKKYDSGSLDSRSLDSGLIDGGSVDVAVRSSGTAEDLPDASFAGQQDTYLNVCGEEQVLDKIKACFASLYTDRAICYRKTMGFDKPVRISVGVQKMVRSDIGCSGVAFSIHPDSGFRNVICITGSYGLGEMVVSGQVKPDEFLVFKPTLATHASIITKTLGEKEHKMIYSIDPAKRTKIVGTEAHERNSFCLNDTQVIELAKWVAAIEEYYSKKYGRWCPVDVEWALDGQSKQLFIVQARPETIHSRKENANIFTEYILSSQEHKKLSIGVAVGQKIGTGKVRCVSSINSMESKLFEEGDVLVTEYTDPTYEPLMKKAAAIITDKGGRTSHAAIVSRELGKTAVVGCGNATHVLNDGQIVTVCCSLGDTGYVFEGAISYKTNVTNLDELPSMHNTKTQLMLNVGNPDGCFKYHAYPVDGVGLAREEFIIANHIGIHPNAVLQIDKMPIAIQDEIRLRATGYSSVEDWYVQRLAHGIALISATFYPRPVIVRFSDFKSNEYKDLLGGQYFEPTEENPMLGFRGCSRYYSESFKDAFRLECNAIKMVREVLGLTNTIVMLPFCRTVKECVKTLETMKEFGLERHKNGLLVYLMCEIPANVILAKDFCQHVDGFSIGSNDLTQLCLGLDRDAGTLTHIGNEMNKAVLKMIKMAIKTCKKQNVKIGICGQGPSDIPEFAQFLLHQGIDSISLIPDSIRDFLVRESKTS